jgi:predicted DNA-binding protein
LNGTETKGQEADCRSQNAERKLLQRPREQIAKVKAEFQSVRQNDIMSDMATNRITIRIPEALEKKLRKRAHLNGQSESEIVREALENYLQQSSGESAYDIAKRLGVIGRFKGLPKDLSTNPKYFEGFGKDQ